MVNGTTANARKCPECGGSMKDGECDDCGYEENCSKTMNVATESHQAKWSVWRAIGQALGFTRNVQGRGHADGQFRSPPVTVSKDVHASATQGADHAGAVLEGSQPNPDGRGKGEVTADGGKPPIEGQEEDDHNAKELMKLNADAPSMGMGGVAPHDASKDATVASLRTEHDKGFSHAQAAMTASAGADSEGAAGAHEKAAKAHEKAATDARVGGDHMQAADHDQAAALHRTAASMHTAAMNRPPTTRNQQSKGEQMTRTQIVARLTANCKCEKSKAAINSLSDEALVSLLANAKATGSLADTSGGGGTVQAGGEEKTSKDKNDEEFDDDVVTKKVPLETNGKKTMNAQQWLAAAPPEIRGAVQNAMQIEAAAKGQLIERLTANVQDPTVKQQLVVLHSGKDLKQLKLEVQGLPPAFNTTAPGLPTYGATYPGLPVYGGEATLAGNAADDGADDLLTAPTLNWSEVAKEGRHAG